MPAKRERKSIDETAVDCESGPHMSELSKSTP
jgi:hypothetical protein